MVRDYLKIRPDGKMIGRILALGIPSGIENSMFQLGKLAIQSTVSTLGTTAQKILDTSVEMAAPATPI